MKENYGELLFLEQQKIFDGLNERLLKDGFVFLDQIYEIIANETFKQVMRDFAVNPEKWINYSEWIASGCKGPIYKNGAKQKFGWFYDEVKSDSEYIDFEIFDKDHHCFNEESREILIDFNVDQNITKLLLEDEGAD